MRKWPELKEGTAVERVKRYTSLLEAETAAIRVKFKAAPEFVQHAIITATREQMSEELYNIHPPKSYEDGYDEWAINEATVYLANRLWITALNTGGIK